MDKTTRIIAAIFFLCLFIFPVIAADFEVGEGTLTEQDATVLRAQEELKRYSQLNQKIDDSTVAIVQNMATLDENTAIRLAEFQNILLIAMVLIVLAGIGLWYSIYLMLKARKLL